MQPRVFIGLDNPIFAGRVREYTKRPSTYEKRGPGSVYSRVINDIHPVARKTKAQTIQVPALAKSVPVRRVERSQVLRREAFKGRVKTQHKRRSRKLLSSHSLLTALAIVLFVSGMSATFLTLRQNKHTIAQVKVLAAHSEGQTGADVPDEKQPTSHAIASYRVAADLPRTLSIPSLGVKARVTRMSVKDDNSLQAPYNIYDVGWYDGSSKPGDAGAMLIDGHVHGPTQPGVFVGLKNLTAGDTMQVERGDGKVFTYKVVKLQSYDVNSIDMAAALSPVVAGKPGLNLMTCTGPFDSKSGEYTQRLVVFATQI